MVVGFRALAGDATSVLPPCRYSSVLTKLFAPPYMGPWRSNMTLCRRRLLWDLGLGSGSYPSPSRLGLVGKLGWFSPPGCGASQGTVSTSSMSASGAVGSGRVAMASSSPRSARKLSVSSSLASVSVRPCSPIHRDGWACSSAFRFVPRSSGAASGPLSLSVSLHSHEKKADPPFSFQANSLACLFVDTTSATDVEVGGGTLGKGCHVSSSNRRVRSEFSGRLALHMLYDTVGDAAS